MKLPSQVRVPLGATVVGVVTMVQCLYGVLIAAGVLVLLDVMCLNPEMDPSAEGADNSTADGLTNYLAMDEATCASVHIVKIIVSVLLTATLFELLVSIFLLIGIAKDIVCLMISYLVWTCILIGFSIISVSVIAMYLHGGVAIGVIVMTLILNIIPFYFVIVVSLHSHKVRKRLNHLGYY